MTFLNFLYALISNYVNSQKYQNLVRIYLELLKLAEKIGFQSAFAF